MYTHYVFLWERQKFSLMTISLVVTKTKYPEEYAEQYAPIERTKVVAYSAIQ